MRRISTAIAGLAIVTGSLAGPTAGASEGPEPVARGAQLCDRDVYVSKVRNVTAHKRVVIGHASGHTIPGGTSGAVERTSSFRDRWRVTADAAGRIGVSVGGMLRKIGVKVEGSIGIDIATQVTANSAEAIRVTDRVRVRRTQTYVFYEGVRQAYGRFDYSTCKTLDGREPDKGVVKWINDRPWQSTFYRSRGATSCAADPANVDIVARAAAAVAGCG
ncbi:hypothetical protein [Nocardioides antri]|uniref:Secreted protein n=1 Tax=Nocardioides antri TaxID=2607659 RepID=A0A5B1M9C5_9ACTN|nr:hypothetical protein [Nocardioides antri]KAA1429046.1 hypothetical protein F0U47_02250 [Nocardioides antri]